MEELKPGDTVKLKSGGPLMTIKYIEKNEAYCEWFSEKHEAKGGMYAVTSLVKE